MESKKLIKSFEMKTKIGHLIIYGKIIYLFLEIPF